MAADRCVGCDCCQFGEDARLLRNLRALARYAQPHRLPPFPDRRARKLLRLHEVHLRGQRQQVTVPEQRSTPPIQWLHPDTVARLNNRGGRA